MRVRIAKNPAGYEIQIKKHWWSFWKTDMFIGMSSSAIETANRYLAKIKISKKCPKKS